MEQKGVNGRRRVLLITHGLGAEGISNYVSNVCSRINKETFDVSLIMAVDGRQFMQDYVESFGVKVYNTCDLDGIKKKIKHFIRLHKFLKKNRYDVVHANMDLLNGLNLMVAWLAGVKIRICHSHNSNSQYAFSGVKLQAVRLYRAVMRLLIRIFSTKRLGCSDLANDYLYGKAWRRDRNAEVCFNGIDLSRFKKDENKKREYSAKLGISKEKINIVTVGRISPQKNPLFIVEVINELVKLRSDVMMTWVGTGEMEGQVHELIEKYGIKRYFNFLGIRKDVPEILACCDYFLFPSLFEGLGIVLIEAQASGLECFISDTIPNMVDCGRCIKLSLDEGAKYWAEKISAHIDNRNIGAVDKSRIKRFDINNTVEQLEGIYEQA